MPNIEKAQPGNVIELPAGKLVNNVWGAPPGEALTSSVFLDDGGKPGWSWQRLAPKQKPGQAYIEPVYPCLRIGGNLWESSKSPQFPVKWGDIKSLRFEVDYKYLQTPTGAYDLAYDLFFTDVAPPQPGIRPKAEVMVWLDGNQKQPPSSYQRDYPDGNSIYALYSRVFSDGRRYYAFIMKSPARSHHVVDAKVLMDHLELDAGWYVPGVELGSEVWSGAGRIQINQIGIYINGTRISVSPSIDQAKA